jgi:hypothetical protein
MLNDGITPNSFQKTRLIMFSVLSTSLVGTITES